MTPSTLSIILKTFFNIWLNFFVNNSELDKMKEDLYNVKGELGEIKGLLSTLVQKLNN